MKNKMTPLRPAIRGFMPFIHEVDAEGHNPTSSPRAKNQDIQRNLVGASLRQCEA